MYITTIRIHGRPEKRREIIQTITGLTEKMTEKKSCIRSNFYQDIEDRNIFYLIEEWRTERDLDSYMRSKSLKVLLGIQSLLAHSLEIHHGIEYERRAIE